MTRGVIILGLDPGYERSAVVAFDGFTVLDCGINPNLDMLDYLEIERDRGPRQLVVEQIESFGMAVGKEVFETVFWTGRFVQAWMPKSFARVPRRLVKQHLCHTARATDANIRQALIDRFGGTDTAIGKKKTPGPLYGVRSHCWAALAVAVTWYDQHGQEDPIRSDVNADFIGDV